MSRLTLLALLTCSPICGISQLAAQEVEVFCVVREMEEIEVPAQRDGILESLRVARGHLVDEKQLMAEQDRSVTQLELNVAKAQLEKATERASNPGDVHRAKVAVVRAEKEKAMVEELGRDAVYLERFRMHNNLGKAKADLVSATSMLEQDKLDVAVKRAEAAVLENTLRLSRLYSPVNGVVRELKKNQGEWVEKGEPIVVITRMDTLLAEGFLDSKTVDINAVIDAKAVLTFNLGGKENAHTIEGLVVRHAAPKVELDGKFPVWVEFSNRLVKTNGEKNWLLRPGMRATIRLELNGNSQDNPVNGVTSLASASGNQ